MFLCRYRLSSYKNSTNEILGNPHCGHAWDLALRKFENGFIVNIYDYDDAKFKDDLSIEGFSSVLYNAREVASKKLKLAVDRLRPVNVHIEFLPYAGEYNGATHSITIDKTETDIELVKDTLAHEYFHYLHHLNSLDVFTYADSELRGSDKLWIDEGMADWFESYANRKPLSNKLPKKMIVVQFWRSSLMRVLMKPTRIGG